MRKTERRDAETDSEVRPRRAEEEPREASSGADEKLPLSVPNSGQAKESASVEPVSPEPAADGRPVPGADKTGAPTERKIHGVEKRLNAVRNAPPFRLWDILVYGVAILAIAAVLLAVFLPKNNVTDGARLEVYRDGKKTASYLLNTDGEFEIKAGETVVLRLVVFDGAATVTGSTCEDHLCEKMRIDGRSRQIVCLPNKIVIQLVDGIGGQENLPGGVV